MRSVLCPLLAALAFAPGGMRTYRSDEAIIKSNAPADEAKSFGKRIDRYCELFEEFYAELGLKKKADNTLKVRLFATYDEYEEYYKRGGGGLRGTPLAYFSPSLNSIVMYSDERDVALRAVVFHESSHQFLNRYMYDCPRWLNEGLAEFFEGWKVPEEGAPTVRPHLFDVMLVQQALERGVYLAPSELVAFDDDGFLDFAKNHPDLHSYLHYATSWSIVYYSLTTEHEEDRERFLDYLNEVRAKGELAEFEVDDWGGFTDRWRAYIEGLDPTPTDATDHFLVSTGHRTNREWADACAALEKAIAADPLLPGAQYWLGYCYKRRGDYPNAGKALEQAILDDPEDPRPHYYLARMYLGIDSQRVEPVPATALEYAEAASELTDETSPLYLWLIAKCHIALGDHRKARRAAKQILKVIDKEERETWERLVDELEDEAR